MWYCVLYFHLVVSIPFVEKNVEKFSRFKSLSSLGYFCLLHLYMHLRISKSNIYKVHIIYIYVYIYIYIKHILTFDYFACIKIVHHFGKNRVFLSIYMVYPLLKFFFK